LYSLSYIFFDVMPGWRRAGSWLDADWRTVQRSTQPFKHIGRTMSRDFAFLIHQLPVLGCAVFLILSSGLLLVWMRCSQSLPLIGWQ
jgi:hypothetical protein